MVNNSNEQNLAHRIIVDLIPENSIVLDLGCGSGELLKALQIKKKIIGRGVEINENMVIECLRKGLSVFQGNIDEGLKEYPDNSYDYVILNQTLQSIHNIGLVLSEMLRVGRNAIVGIPNFAHWKIRVSLGFKGILPQPNGSSSTTLNARPTTLDSIIRLVTVKQLKNMCAKMNISISQQFYLAHNNNLVFPKTAFPNLFSENAIFVLGVRSCHVFWR